MPDPFVRTLGTVTDIDGRGIAVSVDYDTVSLIIGRDAEVRLSMSGAEEFARLFVSACWQAAASLMRPDVPDA